MEKTNIKKITWRDWFNNLFGVNNDIETDLIEELKKSHLYDTMNNVNKMAETFNTPINCTDKKSTKNGGFSDDLSKFDKTLAKMQRTQGKGIQKPVQDKAKEDDDEIVK